jgi:DNA-directed RNA polymerase specialized sigma24 family protein
VEAAMDSWKRKLDALVDDGWNPCADDIVIALASLRPRQAQIIEMYRLGGLTQKEIAAHLGVRQPTVSEHVKVGMERLAEALVRMHEMQARVTDK